MRSTRNKVFVSLEFAGKPRQLRQLSRQCVSASDQVRSEQQYSKDVHRLLFFCRCQVFAHWEPPSPSVRAHPCHAKRLKKQRRQPDPSLDDGGRRCDTSETRTHEIARWPGFLLRRTRHRSEKSCFQWTQKGVAISSRSARLFLASRPVQ